MRDEDRADALDAEARAGGDVVELATVLDTLARDDHGLRWRYIPGGRFQMGSETGEPDERPVHEVSLRGFYMTEVPLSWSAYNRLIEWPEPPAFPELDASDPVHALHGNHRIRLQYCEDRTLGARDWHAHDPIAAPLYGFGAPERSEPSAPYSYRDKPVVAVSWQAARELAAALGPDIDLPTEAQWERAARGLYANARYPWGEAPASPSRCDCDAFDQFRIQSSRSLPANDYGLFAMSGGVWEWCRDQYDAGYYAESPDEEPWRSPEGDAIEYVLRGGSWADCGDACAVSFRMGLPSLHWDDRIGGPSYDLSPVVGFRLVMERSASHP